MATEDALLTIDEDWADIEPRLTVRELTALATIGSDVAHPDRPEPSAEAVFRVFAAILDPEDRAWDALRQSRTRYAVAPERPPVEAVVANLRFRAQQALIAPSIAEEAAADSIADIVARNVLRYGWIPVQREPDPRFLRVDINNQSVYPAFQFDTDSLEPHPIVLETNARMDAAADALGTLSWWFAPNGWLDTFPAALIGTGREAEIGQAADQLTSDSW